MIEISDPSCHLDILLVEDDPADVILTQECLGETNVRFTLNHAENGEAALTYLAQRWHADDSSAPDLELLDLNMPVMDGRQMLTKLRTNARLKHLPVIVLTTSDSQSDVLDLYRLGATSYIRKPTRFEEFVEVMKTVATYWSALVKLPRAAEMG